MMIDQNWEENLGVDIDESDEVDYRSHPAIANSDLKYLYNPTVFYNYKFNPPEKQEPKKYQLIGTMFEDFITMDKEEFDAKYYLMPEVSKVPTSEHQTNFSATLIDAEEIDDELIINTYCSLYKGANAFDDKSIKKALALYDELYDYISSQREAKNRISYSSDLLKTLENMKYNLLHDPAYQDLFNKKGVEIKHRFRLGVDTPIRYWELEWKGELDFLIIDHVDKCMYIVDLKTTGKPLALFGNDIVYYKYYRQLAHYRNLIVEWAKGTQYKDYPIYCRIIAVETNQFNHAKVIPIPKKVLDKGNELLYEAAQKILFYQSTNYSRYKEVDPTSNLFLVDWDKTKLWD